MKEKAKTIFKKVMKIIGLSLLGALLLATMLFAWIGSSRKHKKIVCSDIIVEIQDSSKLSFVNIKDIKSHLDRNKIKYKGLQIDAINLVEIEKAVEAKSAVKNCEAYVTLDGILHIELTQKEPKLRFQAGDRGYYADQDGSLFPLQRNHTAHVPVINGWIPNADLNKPTGEQLTETGQKWMQGILNLTSWMQSHGWDNKIVQIYSRKNGELILVPREGKEKFIFGQPNDIKDKFRRMEKYYTCIKPSKEEGYYSEVDLRYRKQVVCKK